MKRDEVVSKLKLLKNEIEWEYSLEDQIVIDEAISMIMGRKKGKWKWVQYDCNPKIGNWHCSECRGIIIECVSKKEKGSIPLYRYCPNCGAEMEVEE